jgi:hypothetical protein
VLDPLDGMLRSHQIVLRQWQAAQIFRAAWDVLVGSIGGAMDFDRVRGGGLPGAPPGPRQMYAASKINEAQGWLYDEDWPIVAMVVADGMTLERVAHKLLGHCSKADRTALGNRLRASLTALASHWVPEATKQPMRSWRHAVSRESLDNARTAAVRKPVRFAPMGGSISVRSRARLPRRSALPRYRVGTRASAGRGGGRR